MKKVSIIVPVYNVDNYLAKCLITLVRQSLVDIEILVVDDGSTDGSFAIASDFETRFPDKIRLFTKENGGLSDARNFGLDRAEGEFIGFVDSDDYVSTTMFEEMYALAKKHSAEMVICNLQKVNEEEEITQKLTQLQNMPEKIVLKEQFSVFSDMSYFACNKLFHRSLFETARFKKGVHFEDIQLIPQLLLKSTVVAQTQEYHYNYFERKNSISKTHSLKGLDILRAVEDVEQAFRSSVYSNYKNELKNFQILEGVYTFLAYMAFVKDDEVFSKMDKELKKFINDRHLSLLNIIKYNRFGVNYILSLPLKKRLYYALYFLGFKKLIRLLLK